MMVQRSHSTSLSPSRYRWYLAIISVLLGYLLYTRLAFLLLSPDALLTRGMAAMQEGQYDDAERCFLRARAKAPQDELLNIALHVFYRHEYHDHPLAVRRFEWLAGVPVVKDWMRPRELAWRDARENRAGQWLQQAPWPAQSERNADVACRFFDDYWLENPDVVRLVVAGLCAVQRKDYPTAWKCFQRFELQNPRAFDKFTRSAPLLLWNYAQAAGHTGHHADADRLLALYRQQPPFRCDNYGKDSVHLHVTIDPARDTALSTVIDPGTPVSHTVVGRAHRGALAGISTP